MRRQYSNVAPTTKLFIDGQFVESKATQWVDLHDPATNNLVTKVPQSTPEGTILILSFEGVETIFLEMQAAVQSCQNAYESWKNTSVLTRQQLMLKLQAVIRRDMKKIAANITLEQGKTLADADGDVLRGVRKYLLNHLVRQFLMIVFCRGGRTLVRSRNPSARRISSKHLQRHGHYFV